eukprot:CAMPEP_0168333338 /NCGR_PEP_ID=MMETSP0213-20121227/9551_1 /TAXON_ID=151035 /ORGANISM="Euplotes harpa, Strain FSP1.4" /LENGTH=113 /DNA_ID=CAMNT_0008337649 /DNA_START=69 /DNA_END=410 /DNA_ORIENTATION=-
MHFRFHPVDDLLAKSLSPGVALHELVIWLDEGPDFPEPHSALDAVKIPLVVCGSDLGHEPGHPQLHQGLEHVQEVVRQLLELHLQAERLRTDQLFEASVVKVLEALLIQLQGQ